MLLHYLFTVTLHGKVNDVASLFIHILPGNGLYRNLSGGGGGGGREADREGRERGGEMESDLYIYCLFIYDKQFTTVTAKDWSQTADKGDKSC